MKVFDLRCAALHSFEGWFASESDFKGQQDRGLVSCPLCGDAQIEKMLSAPRLNLRSCRGEGAAPNASAEQPAAPQAGLPSPSALEASAATMQGHLMKAMREVLAQSEDVGERFADQARAMHHGDIAQRNIRGQTTPDVAMELIEEGIDVIPLPAMPALKETLQ